MGRKIAAAVVGYAVWSVIWLGGGQGVQTAFADSIGTDGTVTATPPLITLLALSVVCSLLSGIIASKISGAAGNGGVIALCVLLLATGVGVQASVWEKMPVWYHTVFLLLLVPVTVAGGSLVGGARPARA